MAGFLWVSLPAALCSVLCAPAMDAPVPCHGAAADPHPAPASDHPEDGCPGCGVDLAVAGASLPAAIAAPLAAAGAPGATPALALAHVRFGGAGREPPGGLHSPYERINAPLLS